jgi:flagellar hook-associated protein 1 FlgK
MSISKLLDISRQSLFVYQKALEVTSNNIANANTPDFSRQKVIFSTIQPDKVDGLGIGSGVQIGDILRIKNQFIESQIRSYSEDQSFSEKKANLLSNLESILSEPSDLGISNLLNEFFNTWEELSVNPQSTQLRANVVQAAQNLSDKLHKVYENFNSVKNDLGKEAEENVKLINTYTSEIKSLNDQIFRTEVRGMNASDLLDKRDSAINELSKIVNINVAIDKDNMANVSIGGVYSADRYNATEYKVVNENGVISIQSVDGQRTLSVKKGSLGAVLELANKTIPDYIKTIDTFGNALVSSINSIHNQGYTNTEPQTTGIDFFESYGFGTLSINKNILNDVNYIAVSGDGTSGNNDIAKNIAELKDAKVIDGLSFGDKYSNFVSDLANNINQNQHNSDSYSLVLNQLEQQKSSYSGVSVDEEMVNILQYQKSYEAAAKLITVADSLFQTILDVVQ